MPSSGTRFLGSTVVFWADIHYSSVNVVIKITRPILSEEPIVMVCKGAEIEWCDTIQTALSKMVLTRICSNVRYLRTIASGLGSPANHLQCSNIPTRKVDGTSFHTVSDASIMMRVEFCGVAAEWEIPTISRKD